jgi:hypothetical protein
MRRCSAMAPMRLAFNSHLFDFRRPALHVGAGVAGGMARAKKIES